MSDQGNYRGEIPYSLWSYQGGLRLETDGWLGNTTLSSGEACCTEGLMPAAKPRSYRLPLRLATNRNGYQSERLPPILAINQIGWLPMIWPPIRMATDRCRD